ncbi:unnamed protein product [Polarella glacialis]|uniref:Uncharacterized protein n=1 Tax=Polarella glacialis TaxID=89957 RepID=A0A813JT66_POLGL|nr:unnamed protein product [Polarella glacialis]
MLYERMETLRLQRVKLQRGKLEGGASTMIQRNWRRYSDYHRVVGMRREKAEADKRISTLLAAFYVAGSSIRHYIHPWWRHLPPDIQEVLSQVKASMQRTIGLVPVTGKLANEEIGTRGLRVDGADLLTYKSGDQLGVENAVISCAKPMLEELRQQLLLDALSHVPGEVFESTVNWASTSTVSIPRLIRQCAFIVINLVTIQKGLASVDFKAPGLVLNGLPANHRHVVLTAEVLVVMRQALDAPSISTEDHLRFQGLDAQGGAQLMEVLSSELDHRLPSEWPQQHGTVAALAVQCSTHIKDLQSVAFPKTKREQEMEEKAAQLAAKAAGGATAKAAAAKGRAETKDKAVAAVEKGKDRKSDKKPTKALGKEIEEAISRPTTKGGDENEYIAPALPEGGQLSHFNRFAAMRVLQQVGYYMRDQDEAMQMVLAKNVGGGSKGSSSPKDKTGNGVRGNRYVSVTDKLFEMADRAKHDHCSFVLSVVLFHMVLRGLFLRLLYHRAAVALQKRYRYIKLRGRKQNAVGPAIYIQRCFRGVRVALALMKKDDAAFVIQRTYKAWKWNRRSALLLRAVLKIQRVWHSSVHRRWIWMCHRSAIVIQRHVRGSLLRVTLDKPGRALALRYRGEMKALVEERSEMPQTEWFARTAVLAAKARVDMHRHRQRNLDLRRMTGPGSQSLQARAQERARRLRYKGAIQPARESIFEPLIFALARLDAPEVARYGVRTSRVLQQVQVHRKALERSLPQIKALKEHAASKRGRAAVRIRVC